MNVKAIINIEDSVLGSMHQITIEHSDSPDCIRVDGQLLNQDHPFYTDLFRLLLGWEDHFEGATPKEELCGP